MEFEKRYKNLNAAQKQAVDAIDGPLLVVAGPGTGKTELLSVRIANILQKTDTLPENILCLTFTDSGALAMRERLISIIGKDAYRVAIHTFHSFGTEVMNQNREYFYNGAVFEPADDLTRYEILRSIFTALEPLSPLASTMNGEYTYQSDTTKVIAELKRSGLTSAELLAILDQNQLDLDRLERLIVPIFSDKIGKKTGSAIGKILPELTALATEAKTIYEVTPLMTVVTDSLSAALLAAETEHPTKPFTNWKRKWLVRDSAGNFIFKARKATNKLRAVAQVYDTYLNRMEQAGLYDYDDMILQVVHALEVHPELKYNLQEKYLYLMVDEFQDTNLAQMRILHNLAANPVNEGRPNLMVVGDDDQAIYSFQGADISNILRFRELYPMAPLIPLKENYRSRAAILEQARQVIQQGDDRLERRIPALDKTLTAQRSGEAVVHLAQAQTTNDERRWIASSVAEKIAEGTPASDIAVLTRHHREIRALLPYFEQVGVPVAYERQDNALDEAPIIALELLAKVIVSLAHGDHDEANSMLPKLLAHPAFAVSAEDMWRLSSDAYDSRKRWLDIMAVTPRFHTLTTWLIEQAQASLNQTLEVMLDHLIGRPDQDTPYTASPLYDYFFSDTQLQTNPTRYLDYLIALQSIRKHLREYAHTDSLTLASFVNFLELHRRLDVAIPLNRVIGDGTRAAVQLMTVHKSKGLEYPIVYITHAIDSVWGEKARGRSRLISYPDNLPLAPAGENSDERLRLFYVAMTRAKNELYISYSVEDDRGKGNLLASFLADQAPDSRQATDGSDLSVTTAETDWYTPYITPDATLKQLLAPTLAAYKLSITHLNTFIDLLSGGPQAFLLGNLLHFPSAKPPAASYGTAIHATLQQAHVHLTRYNERKPLEDILHDFEVQLDRERLSDSDRAYYLQKGSEQLTSFFTQRYDEFATDQKAELSFRSQEVHIGKAHLTGTLDVATIDSQEKTIRVVDYKTGKPITGSPRSEYEKVKLHKYRQQLLFYKLLVEHSRDYHSYTVTDGRLIFIEPDANGEIIDLPIDYSQKELSQVAQLIEAVWRRIIMLDLPDTSSFEPTLKGIEAFEQALIDGTV